MKCSKCSGEEPQKKTNGCNTPKVLQIESKEAPVLFHRIDVPASLGDDVTNPPVQGQYKNILLVYEVNNHAYLFNSDGIYTQISWGQIGGEIVLSDISVKDGSSPDTVKLTKTKVNIATGDTNTEDLSLPVASNAQAGVVSAATYQDIQDSTNKIQSIMSGSITIEGLPEDPTQEQLSEAWKLETGQDTLFSQAGIFDSDNSKIWTYFGDSSSGTWHYVVAGGEKTATSYIKFSTDGSNSVTIRMRTMSGWVVPDYIYLEYSYDGKNWEEWDKETPLEFGGETEVYLRGKNHTISTWFTDYVKFVFSSDTDMVDCSGNIMALLDYEGKRDLVVNAPYCFAFLFADDVALKTAPELPAMELGQGAYNWMFSGTSLTSAPDLPATYVGEQAYNQMFAYCPYLVNVPSELPAEYPGNSAYSGMFSNCPLLATAPVIKAKSAYSSAFSHMFNNSPNISRVEVPNLSSVADGVANQWLDGASPTGTFVKKTGSVWPTGESGIPSGWDVIEV